VYAVRQAYDSRPAFYDLGMAMLRARSPGSADRRTTVCSLADKNRSHVHCGRAIVTALFHHSSYTHAIARDGFEESRDGSYLGPEYPPGVLLTHSLFGLEAVLFATRSSFAIECDVDSDAIFSYELLMVSSETGAWRSFGFIVPATIVNEFPRRVIFLRCALPDGDEGIQA
jgi:hypothetical protein